MWKCIKWFFGLFFRKPVVKLSNKRSGKWRSVRKKHLLKQPNCAVCGKRSEVVHHIIPFHIDRSKELDANNLITLCEDHHLLFGHLFCWSSHNSSVVEDARIWREKIANRP